MLAEVPVAVKKNELRPLFFSWLGPTESLDDVYTEKGGKGKVIGPVRHELAIKWDCCKGKKVTELVSQELKSTEIVRPKP